MNWPQVRLTPGQRQFAQRPKVIERWRYREAAGALTVQQSVQTNGL